jgi:hypothetical protein
LGTERKERESDDPRAEQPEERPTVIPKFDPAELAKRTADSTRFNAVRTGTSPSAGPHGPPETPPPATAHMSDSTRSSLLSLADARMPSVRPEQPGSIDGFAAVDRWASLQLDDQDEEETRPGSKVLESLRAWTVDETGSLSDEVPTREHGVVAESGASEPPAGALDDAPTSSPPSPPPPRVRASSGSTEDTIREMRDRFSLGDYTGALGLAERLASDVPRDAEVKDCAAKCRQVLRQMYTARLGPLDRVPFVVVARDQLRWLSIDHRAGFVLSHVDGVSSLETILDVSGMPTLDALRILCELAQQRIISFR